MFLRNICISTRLRRLPVDWQKIGELRSKKKIIFFAPIDRESSETYRSDVSAQPEH